jgi:uncharacterized membrane protein YphA (DoxX/SURF4 family)
MKNPPVDALVRAADTAMRLFLGGLFVYASIHKLRDPVEFARIVYGYKLLPAGLINIIAIALPGVELVAGVFLITGILARGAALTVTASLAIFIGAIGFNLARGLEFDCGCFSFARSKHGAAFDLLVRDIVLLGMGLRIYHSSKLKA